MGQENVQRTKEVDKKSTHTQSSKALRLFSCDNLGRKDCIDHI